MLRKTLAIVLGALAIPAVAPAAGTSKAAPKVTYMLKGTLSRYFAASAAAGGSITIQVSGANYHARFLRGRDFTFAITTTIVIKLNGNSTIGSGSRGVVKFRAPKKMTNAALMTALRPDHMRARQVIDQGRFQPG